MTKEYYAHISEDGRKQTVLAHLEGTAALSGNFAAAFGERAAGQLLGLAHDVGKCSDAFQKRLQGGMTVDHASAGAYESIRADPQMGYWAACCIAGHHGGLPDLGNPITDQPGDGTMFGRIRKVHEKQVPPYEMILSLPKTVRPDKVGASPLSDSFLIRMLYSCLVDADYLDTEQFMKPQNDAALPHSSLRELWDRLEEQDRRFQDKGGELNLLRRQIRASCLKKAFLPKGFFTLTVPTGGGKTLTSIAFALRHAIEHGMDRIIYVIPYTSIIEQTAKVFRGIFGEENVLEHHSNAVYEVPENGSTGQYEKVRATENWDAPIIVTTAVQFFESIYSNRPSKCRKLHSIANSVVVFDEAQMLPISHLRPCTAAIASLVDRFGVSAVLCTATQPKLDDLLSEYAGSRTVTELCPEQIRQADVFRRVTFRDIGKTDAGQLARQLAAHRQVLCVVNTRQSARTLFDLLPEEGRCHLTTLMTPHDRRLAFEDIRRRLEAGLPCRVVSTSLIEAGVDVDFPAVYRELAGLDSILQAAGRCNREGKRRAEESVVTIFHGVSAVPMLQRINVSAAEEALAAFGSPASPEAIRRYFSILRSLRANEIDQSETISSLEHGIDGCNIPFRTVAERFHLIDSNTRTVYIPLGAGEALCERLLAGKLDRAGFRTIGQYGVSVYEHQFRALYAAGLLAQADEESAVLTDVSRYDAATGLCLDEPQGQANFV